MASRNPEKLDLSPEFVLNLTEVQPRLTGFLIKRLGRAEVANEVLQEVNLTICRKASEFEMGTDFAAWAFSIARFQLLAFIQKEARDRHVFSEELVLALDSLDSSQQHSHAEKHEALQRCLKNLTPEQNEMIFRRYGESLSVKAMAAEAGRSVNAISQLLHRIRKQLMNCIEVHLVGSD